jgi:hypothetical protein
VLILRRLPVSNFPETERSQLVDPTPLGENGCWVSLGAKSPTRVSRPGSSGNVRWPEGNK